ncbi:RidA family protein [Spongiactinospora sp. TRM90649]|uniref:RidA family protein n=1 Tax=Spongiactinospora sp. TRM90649 TaxID=3031114 RepID=UPI0023F8A057|nr:RidA family protein [Spongiactinospora sp. TRM90649]MDF5751642.1 RidA family protein [Spongiactinospora sp. TRM90649]
MTATPAHEAILPPGHSKPIGRYSPAIRVPVGTGSLVFVSGQVATDAAGGVIGRDDAGAQAEAVFERLRQVLAGAGGDLRHLVSLIIYLTDMSDFRAVSAVRDRLLADPAPSSTLVEVSRLAEPGIRVEISGVAHIAP